MKLRVFSSLALSIILSSSLFAADIGDEYKEALKTYRKGRVVEAQLKWEKILLLHKEELNEKQVESLKQRITLAKESSGLEHSVAEERLNQATLLINKAKEEKEQRKLLGQAQFLLDQIAANKILKSKRHFNQAELCRLLNDTKGEKVALENLLEVSPYDRHGNYRYAVLHYNDESPTRREDALMAAKIAADGNKEAASEFANLYQSEREKQYFENLVSELSIDKARDKGHVLQREFSVAKKKSSSSGLGSSGRKSIKYRSRRKRPDWSNIGSRQYPAPEMGYWPKKNRDQFTGDRKRPPRNMGPARTYRSSKTRSRRSSNSRSYRSSRRRGVRVSR